jgi:hypothetical protein
MLFLVEWTLSPNNTRKAVVDLAHGIGLLFLFVALAKEQQQ